MSTIAAKQEARIIAGAVIYAEYDASDPFTFARCMTHIKQGICGACEQSDFIWHGDTRAKSIKVGPDAGSPGHYEAQKDKENFRNIARV